jgi:hypothetical protein
MLPSVYIVPVVAREIVQERERGLVRRQLLGQLPEKSSRVQILSRSLAGWTGMQLVRIGLRLHRFGHQEFVTESWVPRPNAR